MTATPPDRPPNPVAGTRTTVALALDLGLRIGVLVVLGVVVGFLLDGWLGTQPIFTLVGVLLGIGAAFYTMWEIAQKSMKSRG